MKRKVIKAKATKKKVTRLAFCSFCGFLAEWAEDEDGWGWRCLSCGVIRGSEPPWSKGMRGRGRPRRARGAFHTP